MLPLTDAKVVEEKLGKPVKLMDDVVGEDVEAACADPEPGWAGTTSFQRSKFKGDRYAMLCRYAMPMCYQV